VRIEFDKFSNQEVRRFNAPVREAKPVLVETANDQFRISRAILQQEDPEIGTNGLHGEDGS
jgi:hypothetical protein